MNKLSVNLGQEVIEEEVIADVIGKGEATAMVDEIDEADQEKVHPSVEEIQEEDLKEIVMKKIK